MQGTDPALLPATPRGAGPGAAGEQAGEKVQHRAMKLLNEGGEGLDADNCRDENKTDGRRSSSRKTQRDGFRRTTPLECQF